MKNSFEKLNEQIKYYLSEDIAVPFFFSSIDLVAMWVVY